MPVVLQSQLCYPIPAPSPHSVRIRDKYERGREERRDLTQGRLPEKEGHPQRVQRWRERSRPLSEHNQETNPTTLPRALQLSQPVHVFSPYKLILMNITKRILENT